MARKVTHSRENPAHCRQKAANYFQNPVHFREKAATFLEKLTTFSATQLYFCKMF
jgi:hypothetical protein